MDGVIIFQEYEVIVENTLHLPTFVLIVLLFAAIGAVVCYKAMQDAYLTRGEKVCFYSIFILMFLLLGAIPGVIFGAARGEKKYETHYKALFTEDVNMQEFQERYQIIDVDNLVYIIKEREK
jgi:hypothetical protein